MPSIIRHDNKPMKFSEKAVARDIKNRKSILIESVMLNVKEDVAGPILPQPRAADMTLFILCR